MKKQLMPIYESLVIILGIGVPLIHALVLRPAFPPLADGMVFILTSIICALVYISLKNTILSFEVVVYFFILLVFGGIVASVMAIVTLLIVWTIKSFKYIMRKEIAEFRVTIKTGVYNAGVYGLMYLLAGRFMVYFPRSTQWILAIPTIIILNELFFSIHTLLKGQSYWTYLKEEAFVSDLMEMLIYPIGISMTLLYNEYGLVSIIPLAISISVFSYIGYLMSQYQKKMRQRITEEEDLNEIARKLEGILDFEQLITTILRKVHSFIRAEEVTLILEDQEQGINLMRNYDGRKIRNLNFAIPPKSISAVELPLVTRDRNIGTIIVKPLEPLDKESLVLLTNLVKHISLCLANSMLYKISIEDTLTGLYTRRYFEQKLTEGIMEVQRDNTKLAIVLFDIDNLKDVNDQLGHKMGDHVLRSFSQILKAHSRKQDVIARWGGDEFVAIIPGASEDEAHIFGERMKELFSNETFIAENKNMKCSVSYGSLEYHPKSRIRDSEIFHEVDKRLLLMKKAVNRQGK
ncbi:MAG: GGDEF domain-containing protein [candidate division WOR-3 bacterium]|nr:MAG: GGDEF domain-containing protein [candidate division WOR-3 bacterium]